MGRHSQRQSLGIFGFGAFGQMIVEHLAPYFDVFVFDPVSENQLQAGDANFATIAKTASSDLVVLATPVRALEDLVDQINPYLKPGATVFDVGSVKMLPARILQAKLPAHVDLICTHPLFGPQSAANGLQDQKIVLCPMRGNNLRRVKQFLERLSLKVIVSSPEEHDREAAVVQGLTHLIAKVLVDMEPLPKNMTTKSFDLLIEAIEMVRYDSPSVFHAIEQDNPFARDVRDRFFSLSDKLSQNLDQDKNY